MRVGPLCQTESWPLMACWWTARARLMMIWGVRRIQSFWTAGASRSAQLLGEVVKLDRAGAGQVGEVG